MFDYVIVGSTEDQMAVEAVVRDYFEGWFTGNVDRMNRALHPELVKRTGTRVTATQLPAVTKDRMLELTAAGEGAGDVGDGRLDIEINDIHENIASVTVRGGVYREYLQLVRTSDGWTIANALWAYDD